MRACMCIKNLCGPRFLYYILAKLMHCTFIFRTYPMLIQIVKDIQPICLDVPMVLIKPPQACSTAEVYKVM